MPFFRLLFRSHTLTTLPADLSHGYRLWLFCICAGMLLFFTQVTVLFPVLPLYLVQRWGSQVPVGLVVGAMAVGLLLFRPGIGWLIDRWGRKPVLGLGLLVMVGILPLYGWSPSPVYLMGIRVLHGVSQAAFATASQTLLADLVPRARRTQMMGYLAMSNTIGFSLGPLLGSVLFAIGGFSAALLAMAVLTLLGFLLLLPLPTLSGSAHSCNPNESGTAIGFPWKYIRSFPIRDATFIFFVGSFLHGGAVTFLPLFLPNSAVFYSVNALSAVLVRFGLGRWGQRVPQQWLISLALLCSGSALVGLSQLPEFLIFWSILYGCGFGSLFPVLSAIVSLAAPAEARGRVYSFFLAGFDAGMTLGSAGMQPFIQTLPLSGFFVLLGGTGCSVSMIAFRQFAKPVVVAKQE
ncbi:MFS transporter [Phormidium tenue FACHB-886]|nr:MFS transporter [Phormidium tenue FACHB-886]